MINFETKKVLFIDLDSTLIKTISGKTFPEDITDFRIQLPVLNKIVEKLPNLNSFYIVTNQGGVGTYYTKEDIDFFATVYENEVYLIPVEICGKNDKILSFKSTLYSSCYLLEDYKADKILEKYENKGFDINFCQLVQLLQFIGGKGYHLVVVHGVSTLIKAFVPLCQIHH